MSGRRYHRQGQVYEGDNNAGPQNTFKEKTLALLYNPFSIKSNHPKWPDGLATFSIGHKKQNATELYGNNHMFALYPGQLSWCHGVAYDARIAPNDNFVHLNRDYSNTLLLHGVTENCNSGPDFNMYRVLNSDIPNAFAWTYADEDYTAWRPVSYGMKIRCCNTDDENEGWYEAIRLDMEYFRGKFGVFGLMHRMPVGVRKGTIEACHHESLLDTTHAGYVAQKKAAQPYFKSGMTAMTDRAVRHFMHDMDWYRFPTYACGSFKDIGDVMFQLNPTKEDNSFIKTRNVTIDRASCWECGVWANMYDAVNPKLNNYQWKNLYFFDANNPSWGRLANDGASDMNAMELIHPRTEVDPIQAYQVGDFTDTFMGRAFDVVLVRVHGTENTRTMVHTSGCTEHLVGDNVKETRHMTVAYKCKEALDRFVDFRITKCKLAYHTSDMY